ncbi:MAG: hypothetical protein H7281_04470 [Bacteriovorax sp.]|nr:hypothetical protein [Bacteriovorax sp.]
MNSFHATQTHAFKIMISCAGLGMGNASRICATIEALQSIAQKENFSITCHVVSWGAGYLFLKNFKESSKLGFELTEIQNYRHQYNIFNFLKCYYSNTKAIKLTINQFKPDLLVLDSDYHFISYVMLKIPKISISQASDVLDRIPLTNYRPKDFSEKITLFLREVLDAFFQKIISTKVLVPSFTLELDSKEYLNRIKIPLIVREEFLQPTHDLEENGNSIGVLLSGSEIDKDAFLNLKQEQSINVITPNLNNSNIISHARLLDKYNIIFTQGGLSSISEVIARGKFLIVFPIRNHPEQMINALEVERLGLGMKASLDDLKDFAKLLKEINLKKERTKKRFIDCTGSHKAAEIISRFLH